MERDAIVDLWHAGVRAVAPARCVRRSTPRALLETSGRIYVIAFGKASVAMTAGFLDVLSRDPDDGVVVAPHGTMADLPLQVVEAGHPLPDEGSVRGGNEALRIAAGAGPDDLVVCLVSGGGSAMLEAPAIDLDALRNETIRLLRSGADIVETNRIRKQLSRIKGGGLARAAWDARLVTLVLSDVVGDPVASIASGPTVSDPPHPRHEVIVVGNAAMAAGAVVDAIEGFGGAVEVVTTEMTGEAVEVARGAVARARDGDRLLVYAGETTVTVRGHGQGGRNQEAAVAAAVEIAGSNAIFLAGGTDGIDGPTPAAGGVVDGATVERGEAAGLDAATHLATNDSHPYLQATGDLLITGPTGTNVGDLWLVTPG